MNKPRILCVDDEPNVLSALRRALYGQFEVDTAPGGVEALEKMAGAKPYEVIVSDMRMPRMNGATFLARARERHPESVRILLTGQSDVSAAISAVNDGQIFRFLSKPCPHDLFIEALREAVAYHRMRETERILLQQTLAGTIALMTDVLSIASPVAFERSARIKSIVSHLCEHLDTSPSWDIELAADLSQLGAITLPEATLRRVAERQPIEPKERTMYAAIPEIGAKLIAHIPRLEVISEMIRGQNGNYRPQDERAQVGASFLRAALLLDDQLTRRPDLRLALKELQAHSGIAKPILKALASYPFGRVSESVRLVSLRELEPGMVFEEPVVASTGLVVLPAGRELSPPMLERLLTFSRGVGIVEPLKVRLPGTDLEEILLNTHEEKAVG